MDVVVSVGVEVSMIVDYNISTAVSPLIRQTYGRRDCRSSGSRWWGDSHRWRDCRLLSICNRYRQGVARGLWLD